MILSTISFILIFISGYSLFLDKNQIQMIDQKSRLLFKKLFEQECKRIHALNNGFDKCVLLCMFFLTTSILLIFIDNTLIVKYLRLTDMYIIAATIVSFLIIFSNIIVFLFLFSYRLFPALICMLKKYLFKFLFLGGEDIFRRILFVLALSCQGINALSKL